MMDEKTRISTDLIRKAISQDVFAKWQLESTDIIDEVTLSLGWVVLTKKDEQSGNIVMNARPVVQDPQINKEGILNIVQSLYPIVNKNTFLADIKFDEIKGRNGIMFSHSVSILTDLAENFDFYEIESTAILTKIQVMIENVCFIALTRGREGATLDYMKTVQKFVEQMIVKDQPDKRGGLGRVFK